MISSSDILRGKILIVDDQAVNVRLLEQMLRGAGYEDISSTTDSSKVFELHLANRYDIILLDLHMPGMDGFQVMEHLQELEKGGYLPVLVITAQPEHKLRALKSGAKDFVSKPFDLSEVLVRVHNMLEVRLLHMEAKRLYERVVAEQRVTERLLRGMPSASDDEPVPVSPGGKKDGLIAESYAEVTVLFAEVNELAQLSDGASSKVLVAVLNDISNRLDGTLERRRVVGDAYVAAIGLPGPVVARTVRAAEKALDVVEAVARLNQHSAYKLKVRLGFGPQGSRARKVLHDL
jgi:adenylate cyclase